MKSILDVVRELRQADPPLTYLGADEAVTTGKFLEFTLVNWKDKTRVVPSEALNLPGRADNRPFMYRGQTVRYPTCPSALLRNVPNDERLTKALLTLSASESQNLSLFCATTHSRWYLTGEGFTSTTTR